ncbi:hypothetical protein MMC14_004961 [Varicellaria rhodocarpa]|nr:hypothetical protein [Varicellaria rhodocarpa]
MHLPNGSSFLSQSRSIAFRNNTTLTLPALETQQSGWENYLGRVVAAIVLTFFARWIYQSVRFRWGAVNHIDDHDDGIELEEAVVGIPPDGLGNGGEAGVGQFDGEQANIDVAIDHPMHNGPRPAHQG